jgi:predicted dehydrogenase
MSAANPSEPRELPVSGAAAAAPSLDYRPRVPRQSHPIGLIGCGAIARQHLAAYRASGFPVVALCDLAVERAEALRAEFFPEAEVFRDPDTMLARRGFEVLDLAVHPHQRVPLIEKGLVAGYHVLSQKPFVLDLDVGERLAFMAEEKGLKLAVNQNGRWAPHFSYARAAVAAGLLGEVSGAHFVLNWDHSWIAGTEFERDPHILLYDFAIHWFDMALQLVPSRHPTLVFAREGSVPGQTLAPPMMASAIVDFEGTLATFSFDALSRFGPSDRTLVVGTKGTLECAGPDLCRQEVRLWTDAGLARAELEGAWFPDGFRGTMGELMCAIEDDRQPSNSARSNLDSLAVAFAAMESAQTGVPVRPGSVRNLDNLRRPASTG